MAELAHRTTGYVGADLSALCREAAMQALRDNSKVIAEHIISPYSCSSVAGRNFTSSHQENIGCTLAKLCVDHKVNKNNNQSCRQLRDANSYNSEMPGHADQMLCIVLPTFFLAACKRHAERSDFEPNGCFMFKDNFSQKKQRKRHTLSTVDCAEPATIC